MRTNGIKIYSTINQSYCIIRTFDLRRTLPKYLRNFLHENAVLTIGLTDQLGYSICLLSGQTFIHTVHELTGVCRFGTLFDRRELIIHPIVTACMPNFLHLRDK